VKTIHDAAMPWKNRPVIFNAALSFYYRSRKISQNSQQRSYRSEKDYYPIISIAQSTHHRRLIIYRYIYNGNQQTNSNAADNAANGTFHRFMGTNNRCELMLSKSSSRKI